MTDDSPALGHVHLKVRDLDRAVEFYTDVVGLQEVDRLGNFAFLSSGTRHHDLALQSLGPRAPGPGPGMGVGLYHTAFEVSSAAALRRVYERLRTWEVAVTPIDHGISKALYFDDPDGNGVEVYLDTRETSGTTTWDGTNDPFDPAAL